MQKILTLAAVAVFATAAPPAHARIALDGILNPAEIGAAPGKWVPPALPPLP